jgi:Uma2 family endonuclease
MSYADLERMPVDSPRFELYDGELSEVPAPTLRHQRVALHLSQLLREYELRCGGLAVFAPVDVVLDQHNVVQPDVVFISAERAARLEMLGPLRIPPDLAVEVLSPATARTDRGRKLQLLARFGVKEYWLVDPIDQTLELHKLDGSAYVFEALAHEQEMVTSAALPGLVFHASRIFAR